ncbi:hypothetical protein L1857_26175 [Amycolatopsis thermalba]|uniref:MinD-like ATPase involved in chromosome partitioning or flagellar assembly n=1 Tax=Amycolatopsis thermalba TaxID=944492 RepID=A0ABY4P114_9PSEU|nr:carbon monoxide dehydrogenase maturation protein [Amycolatopsis thermalba]UQS26050.1 hypothetical protein L1857_26175 [Amycolatopsis thermalba]
MLVALMSLKGSPGVTTTAVALAAQWPDTTPQRRLVAEVDPSGGDLAMRFGLPPTPGLVSLAAAARRRRALGLVWEHTQALPGGARVLLAPPGAAHARAALTTLATAPGEPLIEATAREPGVVVLADCGRLDPGSPAEALARRADALVLLTGTHADALAHAAARLSELAHWTARPGLLLTGHGYPTSDVERELGVPAIGRIPHDPAAAAALAGHQPSARRRGGGLARAAAALARTLTTPPPAPAQAAPPGLAVVPGVPAQQVRLPGGAVIRPPGPGLYRLRPVPTPQAGEPSRNGHQPGKEPRT